MFVQAAPDEGQEGRYVGDKWARLGYRMRRSGLVQVSDLDAVGERCICEEAQRSSEAGGPHLGWIGISNFVPGEREVEEP